VPPLKAQSAAQAQAPNFLQKASQFLSDAERALADGHPDSALLLSVHCAISAGDAVTVSLAQIRSTDPDHSKAVTLLRQLAGSSPEIEDKARQFAGLIAMKNQVEYESRRTRPEEAAEGVKRAKRLVDWAATIVRR
jgi:hypothetical protein